MHFVATMLYTIFVNLSILVYFTRSVNCEKGYIVSLTAENRMLLMAPTHLSHFTLPREKFNFCRKRDSVTFLTVDTSSEVLTLRPPT